jgi:RNA binding exosome subunit
MNGDTITVLLLGLVNLLWLLLSILWEHRAGVFAVIVLLLLSGIHGNTAYVASVAADEGKALRDELERLIESLGSKLTDSLNELDENADRLHDAVIRLEEELKTLRSQSSDDVARLRKSLVRLQVEIESWRADAWRSRHEENETKE